MKVSVIITTFNRREVLARTLPTILEQDFPANDYEVIVVVDGATDDTVKHLSTCRPSCLLRVIEQPNRGIGHARNAGVAAACGEILLFLDDDIDCARGLIRAHVLAHGEDKGRVVIGKTLLHPDCPDSLAVELAREWHRDWDENSIDSVAPPWESGFTVDANTSLSRSVFLEVGGYDQRLRARENVEISIRLWRAGVRFRFCPTAKGCHLYVKTADGLRRDAAFVGSEEVLICRKHAEYRPNSPLARLLRGTEFKRCLIRLASTSVGVAILSKLISVAELLRSFRGVKPAGTRLIMLRQGAAFIHSAVRQTGAWTKFVREFDVRLPVLLYHNVGRIWSEQHAELTVSPARFRAHMAYLKRSGYETITATQWLDWRSNGSPLPRKPVMVTFDDGYEDLCEFALPILRENGYRATIFLATGLVGAQTHWDGAPVMNPGQIRYWCEKGMDFGAHSRTHTDLRRVSGAALSTEMAGSATDLETMTGGRVLTFSYPYGGYSSEAVKAASCFGLAFTVDPGLNCLATNPLLMRRTMVQPTDSLTALRLRLVLGYNPWERLRIRFGLRTRARGILSRLVPGAKQA